MNTFDVALYVTHKQTPQCTISSSALHKSVFNFPSRRKYFKAPLPLDQIYREALNSTTSNGKNESKERQPNAVVKSVVAIK
jgi:hypothetical protein